MNCKALHIPPAAFTFITVTCLIVGLAMVLWSPNELIYDERFYHHYAEELLEKGLTTDYIRELRASPGPLYGIIHAPLFTLTDGAPVVMRITTLALFALTCLLIRATTKHYSENWTPYASSLLFGIPFIGVCYSLALTEVPAMCCIAASFLLLAGVPSSKVTPIYPILFAGLLLGLAAWGRQNYIAIVPLAALYLFLQKRTWWEILTLTLPPLVMFAWIIIIWEGLVPPAERHVSDTESILFGISLYSFVFSMGLAGAIFVFLFPSYLKGSWKWLACLGVLSAFLVIGFPELRILPSRFLFERIFGDTISRYFSVIYGTVMATLAFWLLLQAATRMWKSRHSYWYLLTGFSWLTILLSNMKIMHQFSSRYVIVAAPFIILHGMADQKPDRWLGYRLIIGFIISTVLAWNAYQS